MKKFVMAAFCMLVFVGVVMSEEFNLQITKVNDDGTVTGKKFKGGFGGGKGEAVTVKFAKDVKVYKGKFDAEAKGFVEDGDELGLKGLKTALSNADKVSFFVDGKGLTDKDMLEVCIKDGKPCAKLNGKDLDINTVAWKGKTPLMTRVTTNDDGAITQVLLTTGFAGKGKKKDAN
jgi:hypothetical protein